MKKFLKSFAYVIEVVLMFLLYSREQTAFLMWISLLFAVQLSFDKGGDGVFLETLDTIFPE